MNIYHKVVCEMYSQRFYVSFSKDVAKRKFGMVLGDRTEGCTAIMSDTDIAIYIEHEDYSLPIPTLNHEVFHAVDFMFNTKGVDFDKTGTNEHWAYAISWLTEKVLDCAHHENKHVNK